MYSNSEELYNKKKENIHNYENKTYLTINSKDRIKINKIITERNLNKVTNNGLKIIDYNTILVNHVNHGFDVNKTTEIIFRNLTGIYDSSLNKFTIGGIPIDYLNYNDVTGKPIFPIEFIYEYDSQGRIKYNPINNTIISNSYKIKIDFNIDINIIKLNSIGGGNNIKVEKLIEFINGYEDSSFYKIFLPRIFKNIKKIKLISLEMPNAQYSVRKKIEKKYNNPNDYITNNNYMYWINKNDLTYINNEFYVNNNKIQYLLNNDLSNVPSDWVYNKSNEMLLYEHLSNTYLTKINNNLSILQQNFIHFLYYLKYIIINPINSDSLSESNKNILKTGYFITFKYENIDYILYLFDRPANSSIFTIVNNTPTIVAGSEWEPNKTYTLITHNNTIGGSNSQFSITTDSSGNPTFTLINGGINYSVGEILTFTDPGSTTNTVQITVGTLFNSNTNNIIKFYIDDFYSKNTLIDFVYKFTSYNTITNTYNSNLTNHFDNINDIDNAKNIYEYLKSLSPTGHNLYFKFLNNIKENVTIKFDYKYIKYLFIKYITDLIQEISQYEFNNNNENNMFSVLQYEFINYLDNLKSVLVLPFNDTIKNIIINSYIVRFNITKNNVTKTYTLYLKEKPNDYVSQTNIIDYFIDDLKNITTFIDFIKYYTNYNFSTNQYNTLLENNFMNDSQVFTNTTINTIENISPTPSGSWEINKTYTLISANSTNGSGNNAKFLITTDSSGNPTFTLQYGGSGYVIDNNLEFIDPGNTTNTAIIKVKTLWPSIPVDIYGYIKTLSETQNIIFKYNNKFTNYTFIKSTFLDIIKYSIQEIVNNNNNSYSLLTNKPNLLDQTYWRIPNKLNTNIYISQKNIIKKDFMIENKQDNIDVLNIRYLKLDNLLQYSVYPIYSIQLEQGNYLSDTFIETLENKTNNISIKLYDYFSKIFVENLYYNSKISLKTEIKKHDFSVDLDENTNIINIYQYDIIYSYSSLDLTEINQSGPFIVNEGFPFLFIKHKNHNLHTGDIIQITGANTIFNISTDFINIKHYVYIHPIYRCNIRFIIPLEEGTTPDNIDSQYYYEANTFLTYSSYKSGLNKIYSVNTVNKKHIGTNTKDYQINYDIAKYELILGKTKTNIDTQNIIGRVINISYNAETENYFLDYALLTDINFEIGMIFKTSSTNTYAMIIPDDWTNDYLPKNKDINITNKITKIDNISEGYTIKTSVVPNKTSLNGIGGININIKKPVEFSLLFNKQDSIYDILGFQNSMTDFNIVQSNTFKTNENIIEYSYLEPNFNDSNYDRNRYIMLKTVGSHKYNVGDIININNHSLNYNLINTNKSINLHIKQYEPFVVWYNNLSYKYQKIINSSLTVDTLNYYKKRGIIIYYSYPYSNTQLQDLGNLGLCVKKYNEIDYLNYKETPFPNIYNLKKDSYIYINQNQKTVTKEEDGIEFIYKIGLRDGFYKILNNLPQLSNSYYSNYFNNTNCSIIDCTYTTINENNIINEFLNYSEETVSNSSNYSENILEGYLNGGEIIASTINTNILGNTNISMYDFYKTVYKETINSKSINLYFPIYSSTYFYLNYINNIFYINDTNIKSIDIYKNITYIFDISNIHFLNQLLIISNIKNTRNQYISDNININNLPGTTNSNITLNISTYENIDTLYLVNNNNICYLTLNIKNKNKITYNVTSYNYNFEFNNNNTRITNKIFNIHFNNIYVLKFNALDYENFKIITFNNYNIHFNNNLITYDKINYIITISIIDNDYPAVLYYHYKNNNKILGKFIFGIYNYYNVDKTLLFNSKYIDNINDKNININTENFNNDLNIIDNINYNESYKYYFNIILKKNIININSSLYIIPQHSLNFIYQNTQKNQKFIKIQKHNYILSIINTFDNYIIFNEPNTQLYVNNIVTFITDLPNTLITINSSYYIIEVDSTFTKIKLGNLNNKNLVNISSNNTYANNTIKIRMYTTYDYLHNELINKSIKINYLQSYTNLTNNTYNEQLSIINNDINYINSYNNTYYNYNSSNVNILNNTQLQNLSWNSPSGFIRIKLDRNSIINYINITYSTINNNSVKKIHLYYVDSNIINYIGSIEDISLTSTILNDYTKNEYILYFESVGLANNQYSELFIPNIFIGFNNSVNNIKNNYLSLINSIKIDNITNKYIIPNSYLDINTINETNSLLLNKTKSCIIDFMLDTKKSIKYYNISQKIYNLTTFDSLGQPQNTFIYENGKITSVQLFASDNIDFSNEIEITSARYIDNTNTIVRNIELSFVNTNSYKYYRFKLLNNKDFYPNTSNNEKNTNDIQNFKFNLSISGIIIGDLKQVNYSDLYIEDINYIDKIISEDLNSLTLQLRYNLLNSHLKGENVIIMDTNLSENSFTTQNLIIYNNWYTRIFYQGYDTLYNYFNNSRTFQIKHLDYTDYDSVSSITLHNNSKYIIKYTSYLDIFKKNNDSTTKIPITTDTYKSIFNITKNLYNQGTDFYTEFTIISYYINDNDTYFDYKLVINTDNSSSNDKDLIIKDGFMNEGIPIIQDYLTNNIFIEKMNGFNIPEMCYSFIDDILTYNNTNEIITPVLDNNYDTFTYNYLDLVFKSDQDTLNVDIDTFIKNGLPICGYYNTDNNWNDNIEHNRTMFYTNYYSVTIKGKYLGFYGKINNKIDTNDNILNKSINGFEIIDIAYDSNNIKNSLKIDLKLDLLPINNLPNYLGNIQLIKNKTIKDKFIIGYGGNIYEKKIYKDISGITGDKYIYIAIEGLNTILNTNKISYFSKILLNNTPGNHLYDSFINNEIIFNNELLEELSELQIKFINDEGKLFNFEHTEHSFVLEITEVLSDFI